MSVGTGTAPTIRAAIEQRHLDRFHQAGAVPKALIFAALNQQDLLCRMLCHARRGAGAGAATRNAGPRSPPRRSANAQVLRHQPVDLRQLPQISGVEPREQQVFPPGQRRNDRIRLLRI